MTNTIPNRAMAFGSIILDFRRLSLPMSGRHSAPAPRSAGPRLISRAVRHELVQARLQGVQAGGLQAQVRWQRVKGKASALNTPLQNTLLQKNLDRYLARIEKSARRKAMATA